MRILFNVIFSLILVQQHVIASTILESEQDVKPTEINPGSFKGLVVNPRSDFLAQEKNGTEDICGATCTGPDLYPFGLLACLRTKFEKNGVMPTVEISDKSGEISLPKVVFSPSTSLEDFGTNTTDENKVDEYNKARLGFGTASRLPAAVLFAVTTKDVINGVNCARVNGYTVAPRGRGHAYDQGISIDGSLVIDMQLNCELKNFVPDFNAQGVHNEIVGSKYIGKMEVPSGCTNAIFLAAVDRDFQKQRGMNVIGSCPSVGVTGYFLNGGYGDQTPYIGIGSDVVDEIEMVLFSGKHIKASPTENEEIFYASKGGTGGIGVVTSFKARVIQNPSKSKKYTRVAMRYKKLKFTDADLDVQVKLLMRWQNFLADNDNGRLFGGQNQYVGRPAAIQDSDPVPFNEGYFTITGSFLGSIKDFIKVFTEAGLFDTEFLRVSGGEEGGGVGVDFNSIGGDFETQCTGVECREENFYGEEFPAFGLFAVEYETHAQVQAVALCQFLNDNTILRFLSIVHVSRTLDICEDLNIDSTKYCVPDELLPLGNFIDPITCLTNEAVNTAFIEAAKVPQGFLNRKGPSETYSSLLSTIPLIDPPNRFFNIPNPAVGWDKGPSNGSGTGGLILPKLEEKTLRAILRDTEQKFETNHLVHGAPMTISPDVDGYPHRDGFWNTAATSRTSVFMNILLKDIAFGEDPLNIPIYGNYNPSYFMPDYETHVYGDKAEELSRIRTEYDPIGGFDSPRYPQRDRRRARTVRKSDKKDKKDKKKTDKKDKKKKTK